MADCWGGEGGLPGEGVNTGRWARSGEADRRERRQRTEARVEEVMRTTAQGKQRPCGERGGTVYKVLRGRFLL